MTRKSNLRGAEDRAARVVEKSLEVTRVAMTLDCYWTRAREAAVVVVMVDG